jgi:hypothetical protein
VGIGHPQHPFRVAMDLQEIITGNTEPPRLGVVNRRRSTRRFDDPARDARVGQRLVHLYRRLLRRATAHVAVLLPAAQFIALSRRIPGTLAPPSGTFAPATRGIAAAR